MAYILGHPQYTDDAFYVIAHKDIKSAFICAKTANFLISLINRQPEVSYNIFDAYTFTDAESAISFINKYEFLKVNWHVCKVRIELSAINPL